MRFRMHRIRLFGRVATVFPEFVACESVAQTAINVTGAVKAAARKGPGADAYEVTARSVAVREGLRFARLNSDAPGLTASAMPNDMAMHPSEAFVTRG